jgi:hypothetical protein
VRISRDSFRVSAIVHTVINPITNTPTHSFIAPEPPSSAK